MKDKSNCSTVAPNPAVAESTPGTAALIWGAYSFSNSVMSREAISQALATGAPISGQVAMDGGGGGMIGPPALKCAVTDATPPIRLSARKYTGTISTARSATVNTMAA